MRVALILSIFSLIFVIAASLNSKRDNNFKDIVSLSSILEPSLGVNNFNSRFLKRSSDAPTIYPEIEKFNRMDIVYE